MNRKQLQKVDKFKYKESRKYFEMSGKELKKLTQSGDITVSTAADKELKRREKKKRTKDKKKS